MIVGKQCHSAAILPNPTDHAVDTLPNIGGSFPMGAAIAKQQPTVMLLVNCRGSEAFEASIIPFSQIRIDAGLPAKAGQFAGAAGPRCRGLHSTKGMSVLAVC